MSPFPGPWDAPLGCSSRLFVPTQGLMGLQLRRVVPRYLRPHRFLLHTLASGALPAHCRFPEAALPVLASFVASLLCWWLLPLPFLLSSVHALLSLSPACLLVPSVAAAVP